MHSDRRRGRGEPRILYWHRTPPGVKVGRAALDEDAIRLIEQHNPDVAFDWTRILKGQSDAPERPSPQRQQTGPSRQGAARPEPAEPGPVAVPALPDSDAVTAVSAAEAKLGAEGLARLRGRYAEMLARISDRVPDPQRQAELKATAERLNPDAWVTEGDVLTGLDGYEPAFESLRNTVGLRRRRSSRRRTPSTSQPGVPPPRGGDNKSSE